ncbi:UNVERIFIED_ORG: HxlR family transcriptional regulator [Chitinophaga ginsengisegetis]|uniref:winged helix-turn-helix transcriptional regulator n=2 Tax=Chitinophaga ginsengisegetis TaxID=393003 RepID=UPI000DBFABD5
MKESFHPNYQRQNYGYQLVKRRYLPKGKRLHLGNVITFVAMKMTINETLPDNEACAGSLKNVLDALSVINGRWKLALILCLVQSSKRFNEIQHEVTGISSRILAKELKDLELNDFIKRTVYPTTPVTIIYEATEYSRTLKTLIGELSAWGGQHREKIRQSMRKQS